MTIYLVRTHNDKLTTRAFTDKQLAESYLEQVNRDRVFKADIKVIELITDQFMEQILQPKESHETNTNSSL